MNSDYWYVTKATDDWVILSLLDTICSEVLSLDYDVTHGQLSVEESLKVVLFLHKRDLCMLSKVIISRPRKLQGTQMKRYLRTSFDSRSSQVGKINREYWIEQSVQGGWFQSLVYRISELRFKLAHYYSRERSDGLSCRLEWYLKIYLGHSKMTNR